jgi:putative membrane protein
MSWIKRFLYGILVGITSIAPGISGGTIAIALGFYESLINSIANIFSDFKRHLSYLFPYGVGAVISMATLSVVLELLFENHTLPTSTLFIGLIIGTLPFIKNKVHDSLDGHNLNYKHILTGIIFFIIVLIPVFTGEDSATALFDPNVEDGSGSIILFMLIGIIVAATMIIPGLSGTMILMTLGLYRVMLSTASGFVTAAVSMDIPAAVALLDAIIPIGIGFAIGGFLIARVLNRLFKKIPSYIYSAIFALICATPIVMLAEIEASQLTLPNICISIITLITGLLLVKKMGSDE